jgi:pyridoxal phosphate enzyme (YggS family)
MGAAPTLAERLETVRSAVADAARAAGRDPGEITTIVVTKFHPASLVRELAGLGVRDFGENRHQEAQAKTAELTDVDATWHFIGQLQSNKARAVRRYADVIHSVDRASLVSALSADDAAPVDAALEVFVQVDLSDAPGRGGVVPGELDALVDAVLAAPDLHLRGLMAVAPLDADPARAFASVRALSERVRGAAPSATALSMGMSGDFEAAIREGATHLRIGTAITGKRTDPR